MTKNYFNHFVAFVCALSLVISLFTQYNVALTDVYKENEVPYLFDHREMNTNTGTNITPQFIDEVSLITHPFN